MGDVIDIILGKLSGPIIAALAFIAGVVGLWLGGKRSGAVATKNKTALEAAEKYAKTRKDMDDAQTGNDDPAVLADWLRERGKQ
jgi:hypothetical protein